MRLGDIEEVQIMQNFAGLYPRNGIELFSVFSRRGEPNLFAENDRRRKTPIMNRRLPRDIFGL